MFIYRSKNIILEFDLTYSYTAWLAGRFPPLGYEFEFTKKFEEKYKHMYSKLGWENGDKLRLVYLFDHIAGAIVVNLEDDVLNAATVDLDIFEPSESELEHGDRISETWVNTVIDTGICDGKRDRIACIEELVHLFRTGKLSPPNFSRSTTARLKPSGLLDPHSN